jgi:hypothetical protein
LEWRRLYFLFVLNNQVFILNLLVARLATSAFLTFAHRGTIWLIMPLAWIVTFGCGVIPMYRLIHACGRAGSPGSVLVGAERWNFLFSAITPVAFLLWSVGLIASCNYGGSRIYVDRFLQLSDGLSPVIPFSCVIFSESGLVS